MARAAAEGASKELGQPIIVENKPGGSTTVGADLVARSPADGYTFLGHTIAMLAITGFIMTALPMGMVLGVFGGAICFALALDQVKVALFRRLRLV